MLNFHKKKFDENFKISDYLIFSLKNIIIIKSKKIIFNRDIHFKCKIYLLFYRRK